MFICCCIWGCRQDHRPPCGSWRNALSSSQTLHILFLANHKARIMTTLPVSSSSPSSGLMMVQPSQLETQQNLCLWSCWIWIRADQISTLWQSFNKIPQNICTVGPVGGDRGPNQVIPLFWCRFAALDAPDWDETITPKVKLDLIPVGPKNKICEIPEKSIWRVRCVTVRPHICGSKY